MSENEIIDEITNEEQYKMNIQDEFRLSLIFVFLPLVLGLIAMTISSSTADGVIDIAIGSVFIILCVIDSFNLFMQYILWNKSNKEGLYLLFHILYFVTSSISVIPFFKMAFDGVRELLNGNKIDLLYLNPIINGVIIVIIVVVYVILIIIRIYNLSFRSKVDISKLK